MEKNRINFVLGARKILSVNALYGAKMTWVNGRQVATIYKTGEAKQTEAYIKEQVERLNIPVNYPWVNKNTLFKMTLKIVFRSGIFLKDLDNTFYLVGLEGLPEYCWNLGEKGISSLGSCILNSTTMCRLRRYSLSII